MTLRLRAVASGVGLLIAQPAWASGVEHLVDDSAVEDPGTCHAENWVTFVRGGSGIAVTAPACTRKTWPNLEIGGFVSHAWDRSARETQIGLSPKWNLRDEKRGLGIAVSGSTGLDLGRGRLASASLVAPFTIPAGKLRFNLNTGWQWTRIGGHTAFAGAQVEWQATPTLTLMGEAFTRNRGRAGQQAGLRWNPRGGKLDFDLVYGRFIDGVSSRAVSMGLTLRR